MNIHGKIQEVLAETARADHSSERLSEEDFRHALQRRGIIDDVMKDLHFHQVLIDHTYALKESLVLYPSRKDWVTLSPTAYFCRKKQQNQHQDLPLSLSFITARRNRPSWDRVRHSHDVIMCLSCLCKRFSSFLQTHIDPSKQYLHLQVLGGKAFLEHLQEPEPLPGQVSSTFTLYLHFRNQRFGSRPVPCTCEPDLRENFLLELCRDGAGKRIAAVYRLVKISSKNSSQLSI